MSLAVGSVARSDAVDAPAPGRRMADFLELTKPGITRLVLLTTGVGFYLGGAGAMDWWLFVHALLGTGLVAGGTNALNQYAEREIDGRMQRTRSRPLPAGRLTPRDALVFSAGISAIGLVYLAVLVNLTTALVVLASLASYIFVYTPLKRRSSISTLVGAVPGALPIVAGWTAAGGSLTSIGAWALFWILFFWQLPHFLALAWIYREDYRDGGLAMLTVFDPDGRMTGRQILVYLVALIPVSLLPTIAGVTGAIYFFGALVLGAAFVALGALTLVRITTERARRLFMASVVYLPVLLVLMAVDKV